MTANQDQQEVKEAYEKPAIEVIEMEMEGILCASDGGTGGGFDNDGGWG